MTKYRKSIGYFVERRMQNVAFYAHLQHLISVVAPKNFFYEKNWILVVAMAPFDNYTTSMAFCRDSRAAGYLLVGDGSGRKFSGC